MAGELAVQRHLKQLALTSFQDPLSANQNKYSLLPPEYEAIARAALKQHLKLNKVTKNTKNLIPKRCPCRVLNESFRHFPHPRLTVMLKPGFAEAQQ